MNQVKLKPSAFAYEEAEKIEQIITHLRHILGTYEADENVTVAFLKGYEAAMRRVVRQDDL